ncbi:MAG: efflux RND transporter periplasmic adaptor subunit, partial [Deltaproteobacteria bacterium]|nr:efflux RND transporter periplasmic adaptor subunit [Deltaproteobacteria bacterium]
GKNVALLLLLLLAAGLCFVYFRPSGVEPSGIETSGHIEATEVDMSFRLPGHVTRLYVDEGAWIKKGDKLAELEQETLKAKLDLSQALVQELEARQDSLTLAIRIKEELVQAEIKRAWAGKSAASARYESLKTGSREQEIAEAAAARDRAKAEWENRRRDYERMKELFDARIISASQYDAAGTSADAARAAYAAADERYKLVKAGPRDEKIREGKADLIGSDAVLTAAETAVREVERMKLDLKALKAQTEQARAQLAMAEDDLAKSRLYAPFDGFITVKNVEEKEYVQPGTPVLTLAQLNEVWVKTYVPQTRLGKIYLGQNARVVSDTFPGKSYPGVVTFISPEAEFTPKNVQTKEERIKLVYRIKVTLKNPNQELKIGMPVDVVIQ